MTEKEEIKNFLFENLDKNSYKVFLFWSRVLWNYKKNSDYDIWILGKEKLEFQKFLRLKRKIKELPYIIDLVDFNDVSEDFKKIALKKIEKWN